MQIYWRGNKPYLDLGIQNGRRIRLSEPRLMKLILVSGLLEARVQRPIRIEKATEEYLQRCTTGTENTHSKPKSLSQADQDSRTLAQIAARFKDKFVHDITESDLRGYLADRDRATRPGTETPITAATVNRDIAVLKSFFGFCLREHHCKENPAAGLRKSPEHNHRTQMAATEPELARWREHLQSDTLRDIFDVAVKTTMRIGEVLRLKRKDYDLMHKTLYLANPKEQRPAEVPVNGYVQGIIEARLCASPDPEAWLFPSRLGKPYTVSGLRHLFYRARDKAGLLKKYTVHDLRRTGATAMLHAGVNTRDIEAVLRHKSLSTTERYLGCRPEGLSAAVETISGLGTSQSRHSQEPVSVSAETADVESRSPDPQSGALRN